MHKLCWWVVAFASAACSGPSNAVQCEMNANCDLTSGGMCIEAPGGNQWCAYPDPACPAGYRYSDQSVGDGLAGECVADTGVDAGVDAPPDVVIDAPIVPASWAKQVPGSVNETVGAVGFGSDGSVYIAGAFHDALDLGGGPLAPTGTSFDMYAAKFTAAGEHVWSVRYGGTTDARATRLAVLPNGDVVVGGSYYGSLTIGATVLTSTGAADSFLTRLNGTSGAPLWAASGGANGTNPDDNLGDLEVDSAGNLAVCGTISGTGTFFGTNVVRNGWLWVGSVDGATGAAIWAKSPTATGITTECGVASVGTDVVLAGYFNGTVNAGGSTLNSTSGSADIYLVRYQGADGAHLWSAAKGGAGNERAADVAAQGTASIVVAGDFGGTTTFGGGTFMTPNNTTGTSDGFVAKFDAATGAHQFSLAFGGTNAANSDRARRVVTRADGLVSVGAVFTGMATFGTSTLTSSNDSTDPVILDIDGATGAIVAARAVGGTGTDVAYDLASSSDSIVFGGAFGQTVSVAGQNFTATASTSDGYVVRFAR